MKGGREIHLPRFKIISEKLDNSSELMARPMMMMNSRTGVNFMVVLMCSMLYVFVIILCDEWLLAEVLRVPSPASPLRGRVSVSSQSGPGAEAGHCHWSLASPQLPPSTACHQSLSPDTVWPQ